MSAAKSIDIKKSVVDTVLAGIESFQCDALSAAGIAAETSRPVETGVEEVADPSPVKDVVLTAAQMSLDGEGLADASLQSGTGFHPFFDGGESDA